MASAHKSGKHGKGKHKEKRKHKEKEKEKAKHAAKARAAAAHKPQPPSEKPSKKKTAAARPTAVHPPAKGKPAATVAEAKAGAAAAPKKSSRKGAGARRDGKPYLPGELLIPGGPLTTEELAYFFRGCVAAQHSVGEEGLADVLAKRGAEAEAIADDLRQQLRTLNERFNGGVIEPLLPPRATAARRTFVGFVERVRGRRREIGAFLRGLDLGRTEVSHMDSHGEASLQSLMEWTARIEKMMEEGEEPDNADYVQLHRGLDQLDNTTEAFVVDLELTLRRQRDRARQ